MARRMISYLFGSQAVAAAGSAQGSATLIATKAPAVVHVTGADGTKGVILPALVAAGRGRVFIIKNDDTANAVLKIYPGVGEYINGIAVNGAFSLAATLMAFVVSSEDGNTWFIGSQSTTTTTPASVVSPGAITSTSASAGVGYATGAGGAVTQITSRATGVTMVPNPCMSGAITTTTSSLAAEASADFIVTDSGVAIGDTVVVSIRSGSNGGQTSVSVVTVTAGTFTIRVTNNNAAAGTAETGAIIINFAIIKAVSA